MPKRFLKNLWIAYGIIASGMALGASPGWSGTLSLSPPKKLAALPWSRGTRPGMPKEGAEWLVVDNRGGYWLEADLDFLLFTPKGKFLQTVSPLNKQMNFYGFAAMEALGDGRILLLERLESLEEQRRQDDFKLRSKPGARLIVLKLDGRVETDKQELDPLQPHSDYDLEGGAVYSIHNDGTYKRLDSVGAPPRDAFFANYAAIACSPDRWLDHVRTLPVFRSQSRTYHDAKGNLHVEKGAKSYLMGHPLIEGTGPLAERNGKIYYQIVCYHHNLFTDSVFVEDSNHENFALVHLISADKDLGTAHGHALYVDEKGNLFEGVAQKSGYSIYKWKILE